MERYQQADPVAPGALIAALSPALLRFFRSQVSSREQADDLLEIHCPNLDAWHILVSHLGVAVIGLTIGLVAGLAVENTRVMLRRP
jgi:hypothetical protein